MEWVKFGVKEKTDEEKLKEIVIRDKALKSLALRGLTEDYPEKFGKTINWSGVVEGETIKLIGNFEVFETEVHKKEIDYDGEKKVYTIFLKPVKKE